YLLGTVVLNSHSNDLAHVNSSENGLNFIGSAKNC
ncbi:MAG: hypothetical protein ACI9RO_001943, partial [Alteromonas macleodii]